MLGRDSRVARVTNDERAADSPAVAGQVDSVLLLEHADVGTYAAAPPQRAQRRCEVSRPPVDTQDAAIHENQGRASASRR